MERPTSTPAVSYYRQLVEWAREAERGPTPPPHSEGTRQHPIDQLLGEHHLMRSALLTMQAEASRLAKEKSLRFDYWKVAVDFVGNFGLLCNYRKKANHLFPMLAELGFKDGLEALDAEQQQNIELTLDLCDTVQEADWEKVMRLVAVFVGARRKQLEREERELLLPAKEKLDAEQQKRLADAFAEVDQKTLHPGGRAAYLAMARELAKATSLPDPLEPPAHL
jgi:hemerythrin-like domain-containing protein